MEHTIIRDKRVIIKEIKDYINVIQKEHKDFVCLPENIDFEQIVHIEDTGTISLFVRDNEFYLPSNAYNAINVLKKHEAFGSNKNHQTHCWNNLIINDNDFTYYINHVIFAGLSPLEFFQESLLHEVMHFCGSNGATALMEGLNEYLTRKLALKYHLKTSGCGYPKEIKVVLELEKLFGDDILEKLAFSKSLTDIYSAFNDLDAAPFFLKLMEVMDEEFYEKYYKYRFDGVNGPFEKAEKYRDIDYSNAFNLIEDFKNRRKTRG